MTEAHPRSPIRVTLAQRLQDALKDAMKAHDDARRDTLRMAVSALYNAEKAARRPLTEDEALAVLVREVKTHRESVEAFAQGGARTSWRRRRPRSRSSCRFSPLPSAGRSWTPSCRGDRRGGRDVPRDLGRVMKVLAPRVRDGRMAGSSTSGRGGAGRTRRPGAAGAPGTGRTGEA